MHEHRHWRGHGRRVRVEINGEEIEEKVREAMRRAERQMHRAERHIHEHVEPAVRRVHRRLQEMDLEGIVDRAMSRVGVWANEGDPPVQHSESYAEERMTILKMVQDGKLTPDEAARLLDTLE